MDDKDSVKLHQPSMQPDVTTIGGQGEEQRTEIEKELRGGGRMTRRRRRRRRRGEDEEKEEDCGNLE